MAAVAIRQPMVALAALWAASLTAAYLAPLAFPGDDPADVVTRQTARVAVLFWGIAAAAMLLRQRQVGRWSWTLGCGAFLVHVVTAFDQVHHWSNAAAIRHVEDVSGFGPGLFVSYAFTAVWVADAGWWWLDPTGYDTRGRGLDRGIHAFMALIVFSGTVVYESGFVRWAGMGLFGLLTLFFVRRLWRDRKLPPTT